MLLRMYSRWAESKKFNVELIDQNVGEPTFARGEETSGNWRESGKRRRREADPL